MRSREVATSRSTGVLWMGKKRMRCSGGGSTVISLMCALSVRLVLSLFGVCQYRFAFSVFCVGFIFFSL